MKKLLLGLAAAAFVAPMAARADSEFSVVIQGGAAKYNSDFASGTADTGAAYGARLGIMPTPQLGLELGYLGSQNNLRASVESGTNSATLHTNSGYGDVRVNILPGSVMPYAFGGFGRTWVSGGAVAGIDNQGVNTLPLGAGIDFNVGAFKIGGRFQYNYLFDKINMGAGSGGAGVSATKTTGDFYTASIDLGASFR